MYDNIKERRRFVRFSRILPVKYKDLDTQQEGKGQSHDISAKGLGFTTDTPLPEKANIEVMLYVENSRSPICMRGRVCWSTEVGPNSYRIGVDLKEVDFLGIARALRQD